jgi:hypothetical protein
MEQGSGGLPCSWQLREPVKSFTKNSPGSQHEYRRFICPDALNVIREPTSVHNRDPAECALRKRVLCRNANVGRRASPARHPCHDAYSSSADAGLCADAYMVQRDVALAEVRRRCNSSNRCRWLCNGRPARWAAARRVYQMSLGRRSSF